MRLIIFLVLFFQSIVFQGQVIKFVDLYNLPVSDVYIELLNNEKNQKKYISNQDGVIDLLNFTNANLVNIQIRISHISYFSIKASLPLIDTVIVLQKNNFFLDQVFVTAQISPVNKSAVIYKTTLIDRQEIEAKGAVNLKDLLDKQMNMRISNDNILGSSIEIQGMSGQNIKILKDGIPVIGRLNGNIDLTQMNLNNIERVEIIEGPVSVNYGTDALAGTINLISKTDQKDNFSSSYNLYYESVGNYNADFSLSYKLNNKTLSIDAGRNYFDGWSKNEDFRIFPTSELADTNRAKQWNPKEQYFGNFQYYIKSNKFTSRFYYDMFYEKIANLGFPRMPYYENAFDDFYYTKRNNLGADLKLNINQQEKIRFLFSFNNYNRLKSTYYKDLTNLNQVLTLGLGDQDTSNFMMLMNKATFSSTKASIFIYQIGLDSKIEFAEGARINNHINQLSDHALYFNSEWKPVNDIRLRPAIRISYNSKFKVPLIPSLNGLISKNDFKFRFSYARGFRSPTLKELFFEFVDINHYVIGNEDLDAETSNNYQLSLDHDNIYDKYKIELSTKIYYNDIKNLITLAQSPESINYSYFNIGKYKTLGLSNSISFSNDEFSFKLGSSHIGRYNNLSDGEDINEFSYSHSYRSSLLYNVKKYNMSIAAFYKFTGSLPVFYKNNNQEIIESYISSYNLLDLTLSKNIFSDMIKFKIGIKNIFNIKNVSSFANSGVHSSSNTTSIGYGRTFFTALNFNL